MSLQATLDSTKNSRCAGSKLTSPKQHVQTGRKKAFAERNSSDFPRISYGKPKGASPQFVTDIKDLKTTLPVFHNAAGHLGHWGGQDGDQALHNGGGEGLQLLRAALDGQLTCVIM